MIFFRFCWFVLGFLVFPIFAYPVSKELFASPPPPLVSLDTSVENKTHKTAWDLIWPNIKVITQSTDPLIKDWGLLEAHNFLSITQYDIVFSQSDQPLKLRMGVFSFIRNLSDDSSTPHRGVWRNEAVLTNVELGLRYHFYGILFQGAGLGVGVYNDYQDSQNVQHSELLIERISLYTEQGIFWEPSAFSFLLLSIKFLLGFPVSETPVFFFNRSRIWNLEVLFAWKWDY